MKFTIQDIGFAIAFILVGIVATVLVMTHMATEKCERFDKGNVICEVGR